MFVLIMFDGDGHTSVRQPPADVSAMEVAIEWAGLEVRVWGAASARLLVVQEEINLADVIDKHARAEAAARTKRRRADLERQIALLDEKPR